MTALKIIGIIILGVIALGLVINVLGRIGRFPVIACIIALATGIIVGIVTGGWGWGVLAGILSAGVIGFCTNIVDE